MDLIVDYKGNTLLGSKDLNDEKETYFQWFEFGLWPALFICLIGLKVWPYLISNTTWA